MSQPTSTMTAQKKAQREELFRYTDLNHPLMQVLFNLQLPSHKN